jgi:hypothetical protein
LIRGQREDAARQWDVERCPCLGCDYFHNKHYSIEGYAKKHEEMHANMKPVG